MLLFRWVNRLLRMLMVKVCVLNRFGGNSGLLMCSVCS